MFRDAVDRPVAPSPGAGQGRSARSRRCEPGPLALAPLPAPRLAAAARRRGSTSTSGSAWRSPWRPAGRPRGWGSGSSSGWPACGCGGADSSSIGDLVAPKLRPLAFQLGLWCLYLQLRLLDLPAAVVGVTIPAVKVVWIGLMAWTAFRLIDLGMILYARSERLHDRRSLSDMIVPTAANGLKLAVAGRRRLVPGLPDRQPRDAHPAPGRPRPGRPGRVARGAGHAQELLRDAAADRRAPVPDRRARRGPGHGGDGRERRLPLDPAADVRGLAADDPQLGDGRRPDRQPGRPDLPPLPHRRLAGLRHADRQARSRCATP